MDGPTAPLCVLPVLQGKQDACIAKWSTHGGGHRVKCPTQPTDRFGPIFWIFRWSYRTTAPETDRAFMRFSCVLPNPSTGTDTDWLNDVFLLTVSGYLLAGLERICLSATQ